jgi:hypothetical protein
MSLKQSLRHSYAWLINDKRPCTEYTLRWLNRWVEAHFWETPGGQYPAPVRLGRGFAAAQARALVPAKENNSALEPRKGLIVSSCWELKRKFRLIDYGTRIQRQD